MMELIVLIAILLGAYAALCAGMVGVLWVGVLGLRWLNRRDARLAAVRPR